jgi:hypothetical protein
MFRSVALSVAPLQTVASVNSVVIPPFEICPPRFELLKGQSIMFEVLFHPNAVQDFRERIVIICDNCHVRYFDVCGKQCRRGFTKLKCSCTRRRTDGRSRAGFSRGRG